MQAKDIMTRNVVTAAPDATIDQVAELMLKNDISAIPIIEKSGEIAGLVSEGDLMRRVQGNDRRTKSWWLALFSGAQYTAADFVMLRGRHARDVMTTDIITVAPEMPVGEIARLLERKRIKRVPVIDDGQIVGIVSRANLLQALAAAKRIVLAPDADDRKRRDIVLGALAQVPGLNTAHLNVVVENGRVDIWGIAGSDAEEAAAIAALDEIVGLGEVTVNLGRVPSYAWGI